MLGLRRWRVAARAENPKPSIPVDEAHFPDAGIITPPDPECMVHAQADARVPGNRAPGGLGCRAIRARMREDSAKGGC